MNWRIYYVDDTTFSDEDGTWEEAPADGIVCVVVRDKDYGRYVLNGLNYYYMPDGDPKPTDVTHTNDINPQQYLPCFLLLPGLGCGDPALEEFVPLRGGGHLVSPSISLGQIISALC